MTQKIWAMTMTREELESREEDVIELALSRAAAAIGFYAITNPYSTVQWVGNEMEEKDGSITVLVEIDVDPKINPEYEKRTAPKEGKYEFIG